MEARCRSGCGGDPRLPAAAAMRYETTVLVAALNEWL
jgi:hypothetical protein